MKSTMTRYLVLAFLWSFILLIYYPSATPASTDLCDNILRSTITSLFQVNHKIYAVTRRNQTNEQILLTYDMTRQRLGYTSVEQEFLAHRPGGRAFVDTGSDDDLRFAIHFAPVAACDPAQSNADFCERSAVFAGTVSLIIGNYSLLLSWNERSNRFDDYHHQDEDDDVEESSLIPAANQRSRDLLELLLEQIASSAELRFTAGIYDHYRDTLLLAAKLSDSNFLRDPIRRSIWRKPYLLFCASFLPTGMLQDSFLIGKFDQQIDGLFVHNGALYATVLVGGNGKRADEPIVRMIDQSNGAILKEYNWSQFFMCDGQRDSPLQSPILAPNRSERVLDIYGISTLMQSFIPRMPHEIQYIDSNLLTGKPFIILVTVLVTLLLIIIVVDFYIVRNLFLFSAKSSSVENEILAAKYERKSAASSSTTCSSSSPTTSKRSDSIKRKKT